LRVFINKIEAGKIQSKGNKRLIGVNVVSGDPQTQVEPVYLPLITCERIGGMTILELSLMKPLLLVVFMSQFPFIHIEKPTGIHLEEE
jgi:hypothetical protein